MANKNFLVSIETSNSYLIDVKAKDKTEAKEKAYRKLIDTDTYYSKNFCLITSSVDSITAKKEPEA